LTMFWSWRLSICRSRPSRSTRHRRQRKAARSRFEPI